MKLRLSEQVEVRRLRSQGYSYKEIQKEISVGYGSISRWCQGIILTLAQQERLLARKRNSPLIQKLRAEAQARKLEASVWAEEVSQSISLTPQTLIVMAAMLYWAEGTKLNENGHKNIEITNTDPGIISIMMNFFRKIMLVSEQQFRIIVRLGKQGDVERAQEYWSAVTGIPRTQFIKPELLTLREGSKSLEKYPHGMCRIIIHRTLLGRKMDALIKKLYKLAKINKVIEVFHEPS